MGIYSIGDLHLDLTCQKPMSVFGQLWENHTNQIKNHWQKNIHNEDWVLIAGDTSWAMTFEGAKKDLNFLNDLPGKKLIVKGNHDYWWTSLTKMQDRYPAFRFIQNNAFSIEGFGICGTRGWICPNSQFFTLEDEKIYKREIIRLELALKALPKQCEQRIVLMHYPPTNENHDPSGFTQLIEQYGVNHVIYGHLHGQEAFGTALVGHVNGVHYHLVSADYLKFCPKRIE